MKYNHECLKKMSTLYPLIYHFELILTLTEVYADI